MKRNWLMILCLSMLSAAFAQSNRGNERIESMRIAFITDRLQLTPAEAQRFWPVFNEYTSELKSLRQSYRQDGDHDEPINSENQLDFEQKKLNLKRKYIPQFREAVGQQKVDLLIRAEEDFKRKLVESLRNRN